MIAPKFYTPPLFRGGLVLESDDGYITDYTTWYPTIRNYRQKDYLNNSKRIIPICSALNSTQIGQSGRMNAEQITELENIGWEMTNHGKTHTRLSSHLLQSAASVGETRLFVDVPDRIRGAFEYAITGGGKSELVTVKPYIEGANYIDIQSPLINSYPVGTSLQLTVASLRIECNDGLDELLAYGWNVKNHVVPYHMFNDQSQTVLAERHNSSRTVGEGLNSPTTDKYQTRAYLNGSLSLAQINTLLDQAYDEDKVLMIYGHGERSNEMISRLDFAVKKAIEKNVPILTRQQALEKLYLV